MITVPHEGPWFVYVTEQPGGALKELGPVSPGPDGTMEVTLPPGSGGDRLTITDEREPVPTDEDYEIVSTN